MNTIKAKLPGITVVVEKLLTRLLGEFIKV